MSSSTPSAVVMPTACRVSMVAEMVPSQGATTRPAEGTMAMPSPRAPEENTSSGTLARSTT